ncbi:hypothetical protein M1O20_06545, partial [Dehalococcoidia bacterium]|nr:hypothetical protein [Dehalococcoidia bacterium]
MKKISRAVGIVLAGLMILAPAAALASRPVECPEHRIWVEVDPETVAPGETFDVKVMMDSPEAGGGLMSAQFSKFTFDHTLVQIESMEAGAAWAGANFMGAKPEKIDEANGDGTLEAAVAA